MPGLPHARPLNLFTVIAKLGDCQAAVRLNLVLTVQGQRKRQAGREPVLRGELPVEGHSDGHASRPSWRSLSR